MSQSRVTVFVGALITSTIISGCLPDEKKYEPPKMPDLPEIVLPNGETLKKPDINIPDVHLDQNKWVSEVQAKAKSCVESICQISETHYFELEDDDYVLTSDQVQLLPIAESKFDAVIWPQMLSLIQLDHDKTESQNKDLLSFFKSLPSQTTFELNEFTKNFARYTYLYGLLEKYESEDYDYTYLEDNKELRLKETVMNSLRGDEKHNTEVALQILTKTIFSDWYKNANIIRNNGLRTFILYKYRTTDFESSMSQFLLEMNTNLLVILDAFPKLYEALVREEAYKKFVNKEDLLPVEEATIADLYQTSAVFSSFSKNPWPELSEAKLNLEEQVKREDVLNAIEKEIASSNENFELSKMKAYNICKQSISAHIVTRPTQEQLNEFNRLLVRIKSNAIKQTINMYNEQDSSKIQNMFDKAKFLLPKNESNFVAELNQSLLSMEETESRRVDMSQLDEIDTIGVGTLITVISDYAKNSPDDEFETLSDFCMMYLPKGLEDHTYSFENKIILSSPSVLNPNSGAGVIAHELGHRVQAEMGDPNEKLSQCLVGRHYYWVDEMNEDEKPTLAINKKQFFDEDFADHFSSEVLKRSDLKSPENNLSCLLFRNSNEKDGKISFFGNSKYHPMVQSEGADHSAWLFRLLQIATDLGHMTPSCTTFVENENRDIYFLDNKLVRVPKIKSCDSSN